MLLWLYESSEKTMTLNKEELPLLPLRDVVVYPHMVIPLFVGREKSIAALEAAMAGDKKILLVAQKNASDDDPKPEDIYRVGTISTILQLLKLPDGTVKVLVEGGFRAQIDFIQPGDDFLRGEGTPIELEDIDEAESSVLLRSVMGLFDQYVNLSKKVPAEVLTSLTGIDEPGRMADTIAAHMSVDLDEKQKILEIPEIRARLEYLMGLMEAEIDLFQGRVDAEKCAALFEHWVDIASVDTAFICGPEPMMLTIAEALRANGLTNTQIKFELFASSQPGRLKQKANAKGDAAVGAQVTQATVTMDGTARSFEMGKDISILDAALQNALDAPFACKAGVCSTCKCKVLEGEVEMLANHALEDYEVAQGYVLSCQSYPVTDTVVVDYDQ